VIADQAAAKPRQGEVEVPLRRNVGFQLLWAGSAFTFLGREITDLVYPLVILAITRSPASAGLFGGVQIVAALVFGLPAGELAARFDRRRLLLIAEAVRALATGVVIIALAWDALTLPLLLAVAVTVGASQPLSGSARMLMVRALVPSEQLTSAMTQEEVRSYGASLAGPPLGGLLYAMARTMPLVVTAACYVVSFTCALLVRPPAGATELPAREAQGPASARMLGGLSIIWTVPTLRRVLLFTTAMNMISAPLLLIAVVQLQQRGTPSAVIGLVTAGLAVGGLAGAALIRPLHRLPPGVLMLGIATVMTCLIALIGVPWGPWWLAVILFLLALWVPAMRVLVDVVIFRQVPDHQRGRAIAAAMTVYGIGSALGLLGASQLLEHQSARASVLIIAGVLAVILIIGAANRSLRLTRWPADQQPARESDAEKPAPPA
jgi:MFS family permease